jgi:uncharacterized protein YfaS (alpha-2-macroglobulin family)
MLLPALSACSVLSSDPVAELAREVLDRDATALAAAAVADGPEIPAMRRGELQPPLQATGSGLGVLGIAPQGLGLDPSQVAVVFDRPMVPLDRLEQAIPVRCSPAIEGRVRWAGTSTAVIVPEGGRFPMATRYSCSVPAGTAAADGVELERELSWVFETERPELTRSWPRDGAGEWDPVEPIVLRFNQPMDPATVARSLRLKTASGAAVPVKVGPGEGARAKPEIVQITAAMARDTAYELSIESGLRGAEGELATDRQLALSFRTYPPLGVLSFGPEGEAVPPEDGINLRFTNEVDAKEVGRRIHVSPTPEGTPPADGYTSRWWDWSPRLLPRTTYTVTLDAGLSDTHGQTMTAPHTWSFTTDDLRPVLDAPYGDDQVYPAYNPTDLPVRFRNTPHVDVSVEALDPLAFLTTGDWTEWRERPDRGTAVRLPGGGEPNKVQSRSVDLAPFLTGGRGLLLLRTQSPEVRSWEGGPPEVYEALVQVTDLGVNLKVTPRGATVWVTRLSDAQPVAGAEISLIAGNRVVWTGATDKDGLAWPDRPVTATNWDTWDESLVALARTPDDAAFTCHRWDEGIERWQMGLWDSFENRHDAVQIHGFADRGVYRAGEKAHVQMYVRASDLGTVRAPATRAVTWTFTDPLGADAATGSGTLDALGDWAVDLDLPADAALGDWTLTVRSGDDVGSVSVPIRAYRAPSFRVEVAAPGPKRAGETLSASVDARYLFGAPMKGADVAWSVRRSPLDLSAEIAGISPSFAALASGSPWDEPYLVEEPVSSGRTHADAQGHLAVTQVLERAAVTRPWTYQVEATVTDVDRQQVANRATVEVHSAGVYAGVAMKDGLGVASRPVTAQVVAIDPQRAPVKGQNVKVTVVRRTWDSVQERQVDGTYQWVSTARDAPVTTATVKTAAAPVEWAFTPEMGGYYVVRVETVDKQGAASLAEAGVYVLGGDVAWARSDNQLVELVPDKARYAPGETARLMVKAPHAGMRALVTVEREGIWTRRSVVLKGTADAVEVPITAEMMPNAFVSVVLAEGAGKGTTKPGIWLGVAPLQVTARGRLAEVAITTDKASYGPRDEVAVDVAATLGGRPMSNAHVTLWAVDHGVLSLTAYDTPDLHAAFYAPRPLWVLTADNRLSVYDRAARLAKGGEPAGGGGLLPGELRDRFETTPLWRADLRTDASGRVTHRFVLPDNLTTFRIMAVVDDAGGAFGSGDREISVSRPIIARPALPRFFRSGDRALAGVVVHNNTEGALDVTVAAEATGATLKGAPRTVRVDAGGATEVPFALKEMVGPDVRFRFRAQAGSLTDAVESHLPVSDPRPTDVVATAGSTTATVEERVAVPEGALPDAGGLDLRVSASALVGAGPALDDLVAYPHGCLEQTGSRLRVALLAKELGDKAGSKIPAAELDAIILAAMERLPRFRVESGGYAYWPGDREVSGLATAYAMEILAEAKARGQGVTDAELDAAAGVTRSFLSGSYRPHWWSEPWWRAARLRAVRALARAGRGDAAFNATLWQERQEFGLVGRIELMEAIARTTGPDARTASLLQEVEAVTKVEATTATVEDREAAGWSMLWYGDDAPTSAFLRALMAMKPDHPLAPRLAASLVDARDGRGWSNTWATGEALLALSDYVARYETGPVGGTVALNGTEILAKDLGAGGQAQLGVAMPALKPGPLLFTARGGGRLYYEARLSWATDRSPPRDEGFTLERTLVAVDGAGRGGRVAPGTLVRVVLRVVTPVDRYDVALVDPLPAGLEPVDTRFATTASNLSDDTGQARPDTGIGADETPRWWSNWVFNRRELRDDEAVFYADWMPAGVHTQSYLARATTPGDYAHPAARVEEMYRPEVYGRTEAGRMVVGWEVAKR